MVETKTAPPPFYGTTRHRGDTVVSYGQVERAARDLMKIGERPTVRSVIKAMGKGSPNVVADCLRRFWKDTAAMGTGDPLALMRLPPELADAAVAQWAQALRFAQTAVRHDDSAARSRLEELQREADIRFRSVEIREKEWDMAARVREAALADARAQIHHLLKEQSRDRAELRLKDARLAVVEAELLEQRNQLTRVLKDTSSSRGIAPKKSKARTRTLKKSQTSHKAIKSRKGGSRITVARHK